MTWVDLNGYLSFVLNVAGNFMLTHKSKYGWLVRIVAIVSWGIYGIQLASNPVIANAVTFFCINCYGWWKWQKDAVAAAAAAAEKAKQEKWFEEQRRLA